MKYGPHVLVILDGYGYRHEHDHNAIYEARPEHILRWINEYPSTTLKASGVHVGLLPHMIGNSEVGHLTIGSGRVIKQAVAHIHDDILNGSFFRNKQLIKNFTEIASTNRRLHIMGLLSDAGVHSRIEHLFALIKMAHAHGVKDIVVHPFLDGRDVPPQSAAYYLEQLENALKPIERGIIGTMHGRFYAMDRDNHWERTERSYKVLTMPFPHQFTTWRQALADSYDKAITDEFFMPITLHEHAYIQPDEALIFFNFRADRARQLTEACIAPQLTQMNNKQHVQLLWMLTFTNYFTDSSIIGGSTFPVQILFERPVVPNTFFDVLEQEQKHIFTCAETEKYAHVTYFFNGGREIIHQNETRILIPSKRHYATYAQIPQMSAPEITQTVLHGLQENSHDFYLINYANADMVGHSGDYLATVKAIKVLDDELAKLYTRVIEQLNGTLYITADHGKAEEMWDIQLNQPRTAHTTNKVPFIYINKSDHSSVEHLKELADIAPFMLKNMKCRVPKEMNKASYSNEI